MPHLTLQQISAWTTGERMPADAVGTVNRVCIDSRQLAPGDLFVALPGEHVDGHDFLPQALAKNAAAALVTHTTALALPQIKVADTQQALGVIARHVAAASKAVRIGITGSNGKTTVKTLLHAILALHAPTYASAGNFNNEIGLPLSVLATPEDSRFAIYEMGAGKPGDIAYLAAIAQPHVGLVNTIAPAHLERMHSLDGIARTKGALYAALPADGTAVINADCAFAHYFDGICSARKRLTFGLDHTADVRAEQIALTTAGSAFDLIAPAGRVNVKLPLAGRHNIANALAASSLALALGVDLETIARGLAQASPVAGRFQPQRMADGWTLVDDSYNANPASTTAAIDTLLLLPGEHWLVLGDMAELGADAAALHRGIGELAAQRGIDRLYTTGMLAQHASTAFAGTVRHYDDQTQLIDALRRDLHADVNCLIKGSRSAAMDKVVAALEKKGGAHVA